MRTRPTVVLAAAALLTAACMAAERTTATRDEHGRKHRGPSASLVNDPARIDTGGGRLPDLIVDPSATEKHWVVREEKLAAEFCSVQEGGVTAGLRRLIRFSVTTPNIGNADVFVGSPLAHADPNRDGDFSDGDGMFEFAPCHDHFHFRNYAVYKLIDARTGQVWRSAKKGFCMLDTDPNPSWMGEPPKGDKNYQNCGTKTVEGFQGVSHGYGDTYVFKLGGQYFVLDGGDGQAVVPPGDYVIEITVNPPVAPAKRGGCTFATDPNGMCHNFKESNYANNTARIAVTIPVHTGRDGYGPEKGANIPTGYELMKM
jgi:hypothetical protein